MTCGLICINCNTSGNPTSRPYLVSDSGDRYDGYLIEGNRCQFILPTATPPAGWDATVYWDNGKSARITIPVDQGQYEGGLLNPPIPTLDYGGEIPDFTRDEICGCQVTLSGLMIRTAKFGEKPWFELAWQCLDTKEDRALVLDQKKQAGDTGQVIEFFTNRRYFYDEPNQWLNQCQTNVGEFDQELFKSYVTEILEAGLVPVVVYDGDAGDNPVDGYPNALRQLPIVTSLLSEYNDKVLYARFWDGVFSKTSSSSPANIQNFGREFRKLLPNGYLAIEFGPGYIPVGNGPDDYKLPNGMMVDYDVVVGEFDYPDYQQDTTWQVVARMVDRYNRPSDQPAWDDPPPTPKYLAGGNARGKYFFWAWEIGAYQWIRYRTTSYDLKVARKYFADMGCPIIGLPR